jgi:CheY-like chemotaxis protein
LDHEAHAPGGQPRADLAKLSASEDEDLFSLLGVIHKQLGLLLKDEPMHPEQQVEALSIALRQAEVLCDRVETMLTPAKIAAGKTALKKERLEIDALIEASIRTSRPKAAYKDITLERQIQPVPAFTGDERLLGKMLSTALDFAIKNTGRGGRLTLRALPGKTSLLIQLADETGLLTASAYAPLLHWRRPDRRRPERTAGLELSAVGAIINIHGGEMRFDPQAPPHGALTFELPLNTSPYFTAPRGRSVLIVEDDQPSAAFMEDILVKSGFKVLRAGNGLAGLTLARRQEVGMMLLDVMLPGLDGFEVCYRLKSSPDTSNLPVVMISARSREEDRAIGLRMGADMYLTKPLSMHDLLSSVGAFLGRGADDV